jgi:hypothetical protein
MVTFLHVNTLNEHPDLFEFLHAELYTHLTFLGAMLPLSDAGDAVFAFCSSCARYRRANTLK